MKRTNLIIDEKLLAEAKKLLEASTQSEAVNQALEQTVKLLKVRKLKDFFGKGVWEGDLEQMREDRNKRRSKKARA